MAAKEIFHLDLSMFFLKPLLGYQFHRVMMSSKANMATLPLMAGMPRSKDCLGADYREGVSDGPILRGFGGDCDAGDAKTKHTFRKHLGFRSTPIGKKCSQDFIGHQ